VSRFLDDLARTLAEPMPRSRAMKVLGSALVAAAVPGIRPAAAGARSSYIVTCAKDGNKCPGQKLCCKDCPGVTGDPYGGILQICCNTNDACDWHPPGPSTKCGTMGCKPQCKTRLCGPEKKCCEDDAVCTRYEISWGGTVREGCVTKCAPGSRRCKRSGGGWSLACCPNGQNCCNGLCCDPGTVCVGGLNAAGGTTRLCKRKCDPPQARCNFTCCDKDKRAYRKLANGKIQCHCIG
jgi:hypothetical protein